MAAKKNSLVANINRRKKKGTSRPKSRSTVSKDSYQEMEAGWPKRGRKTAKKKAAKKKTAKTSKRSANKATKKRPTKKKRATKKR